MFLKKIVSREKVQGNLGFKYVGKVGKKFA
jgi:hypothetical protein